MKLAYAPIRRMEPMIVDRLRLAFPEKTFAIERIPQTLTIKEFERLARLAPFLGLAWTGMRPDPASGRQLKGNMLWRLVTIIKASSSLQTRFKGDALGLGQDAVVDVAIALLHGFEFPAVGVSTVTLANSVIADGWSDEQIVIAQIDFQVSFVTAPATFELVTLDDFERLGVSWAVLPDEDANPVSDTIDPPQA